MLETENLRAYGYNKDCISTERLSLLFRMGMKVLFGKYGILGSSLILVSNAPGKFLCYKSKL